MNPPTPVQLATDFDPVIRTKFIEWKEKKKKKKNFLKERHVFANFLASDIDI